MGDYDAGCQRDASFDGFEHHSRITASRRQASLAVVGGDNPTTFNRCRNLFLGRLDSIQSRALLHSTQNQVTIPYPIASCLGLLRCDRRLA